MPATPEQLDYLTKQWEVLKILGAKINRSYRWLFGLAILQVMVLTKIVVVENSLTIPFFNIRLDEKYLTLGISIAICAFFHHILGILNTRSQLSSLLNDAYESLNISFDSIIKPVTINYPDIFSNVFSSQLLGDWLSNSLYGIGAMILIFVPLGVQYTTLTVSINNSENILIIHGLIFFYETVLAILIVWRIILKRNLNTHSQLNS